MRILRAGRIGRACWVPGALALALVPLPLRAQPVAGRDRPARSVALFSGLGSARAGYDSWAPQAVRYQSVTINPALTTPEGIAVGDTLAFAVPDGRSYSAVVDRVNLDVNRVLSIRGRIGGADGGHVLISIDGAHAVGSIELPEEDLSLAIAPAPEPGMHLLQQADPNLRRVQEDGPVRIPPPADAVAQAARDALAVSAADGKTKIDLMVVYTPKVSARASSRGGVNALIAQAVEQGQLAYDNSGVDMKLRLVYSTQVNYTEAGASTDLGRLTGYGDGYMDEVHALRDRYGADLVSLVTASGEYCGMGWLLGSTWGSPGYGFTWISDGCLASYTLVHELGHNMGAHHRKDQTDGPGPGIFPYSAGWRWIGNDGKKYCTVMSYMDSWGGQSVTRVAQFSNPSVQYKGAATGDPNDGDNARTLRETKAIVAGYRPGLAMLTLKVTTGGTTAPAPGNSMYAPGSQANVSATPGTHFTFLSWSGDASGNANPLTLTMDDDKVVTANFQRIIYAPFGARGTKVANRSLSQTEHINVLNWEANRDNVDVTAYRIYRTDAGSRGLVAEVSATTFECRHRKVERDRTYVYEIVAVNNEPREGQPATLTVR